MKIEDIENIGYWKVHTESMIDELPSGDFNYACKESAEKACIRYDQAMKQASINLQSELCDIRRIIKASR